MSMVSKNIFRKEFIITCYFFLAIFYSQPGITQEVADTLIKVPSIDTATNDNQDYDADEENFVRLPDTIELRAVPDTTVARLKASKEFEYANNPAYWVKKERVKAESKGIGYFLEWLFSSLGVRVFMYFLLAVILLYTFYRIIVNNNLFYSSTKKQVVSEQVEENEMDDRELDNTIASALIAKEYRKAVRFLYIKTLRGLDEKGWITYHSQATNYEYLNQVRTHPMAADFGFVTRIYEYVWYGGLEITEEQFSMAYSDFQKLFKRIGI